MVDFSSVKAIEIPEGIVKSISRNGTVLWQLSVGLPSEYQEVEYIQSNGNQYIDTGISGNDIGEYEIKLNALGSQAHSWEQYFAGERNATTYTGKLYCSSSQIVYQGYPTGSDIQLGSISDTLEIKVLRSTGITSNGVYKSAYSGANWGTLTFWIFNSHSEPTLGASMRLYYLKMYSNGELARDFIPCYRKADGVIGLYDLVSKTFFTNAGSGSFTKGGDI